MSYKRKTKIEFTPAQERKLALLAKQRDLELLGRFVQYYTDALNDMTRVKITLTMWDGRIDSVTRQSIQTNAVKSENLSKRR